MGLREYLNTLQSGADLSASALETSNKLRQQAQLQDLAAQSPELIRQGRFEDVAAMAAGAGDMTLLRQLADKGMESKLKPEAKAFSAQDFMAQGIPKEKAEVFAKLDPTLQKEAVSNYEASRTAGISQQSINLQADAQQRLKEEQVQKQRTSSGKILGDFEKDVAEENRAIEKVTAALNSNTLTGDAIVLNFIARAMAGEKGPLAEGDIKRLIGTSFAGDVAGARNYVQSLASSTASPEQRKVFKQMLEIAKENFGTWRQGAAVKAFSQAVENNPKLSEGGKLDKQIKLKAERIGYDAGLDENGQIVLTKKEKKTAPLNQMNPETGAADLNVLSQQVELIGDVKIKQAAKKKLEQAKKLAESGKPLNPDQLNAFASSIKQYLPK